MRHGKGFTLVELVVVLAAIAMLTVIAIPSLNVSRQAGMQMNCRANLHSLSKSMHAYCADNNDYWPPYRMTMKNGQPYVPDTFTEVERTTWASRVGDLDPQTLDQRFRGVGIMYDAGYVEDPRDFYCPAQTYEWYVYEYYTINERTGETVPWGTMDNWSNMVRMGFLFQAWGKYYPDEARWDIAFRTLSSAENDKAMAMDHALFPWASGVHTTAGGPVYPWLDEPAPSHGKRQTAFNVLHPDGRLDIYRSVTIIDELTEFFQNSGGGDAYMWADQPGRNSDWAEIYTQLQAGR